MKMPSFLVTVWKKINDFNSWFAMLCTNAVGSMWCAYLFAAYAIWTSPATIKALGFGNWLIEAFLQFVLLSVIMVGQNVQSKQANDLLIAHIDMRNSLDELHAKHDDLHQKVAQKIEVE
jgi:hypothetical protein